MPRFSIIAVALALILPANVFAVDLTKVDRSAPKLPALQSDHPEYCLLVFGAEAQKRVWLVRDGNVLYVDRNGNGDLTEPGERVEANRDESNFDDGVLYFHAGDIPDGALTHKDLRVSWYKLDHLIDEDARVKALLANDPKWRGCRIEADIEIPGQQGGGIDGRVIETTSWQDQYGLLQFAARPDSAPIIHFDGPWELTFWDAERWQISKSQRVDLCVGTPGLGVGATAYAEYQGLIPSEIKPTLMVTFPTASGGTPITRSYELSKRCCGIDLYGNVDVPADVEPGKAQVDISIPNWPGVSVASTHHTIEVVQDRPKPKLEAISARLKARWPHSNRGKTEDDSIVGIQYSPDGKRLIAGDYPGGAIDVWDVETGNRLWSLQAGEGYRSSWDYFRISPDWQLLYTSTVRQGHRFEKIEKDGKSMTRWSFDDAVRVFEMKTGQLVKEWKNSPPGEINFIQLSPDGGYLVTSDGLPGDYEGRYKSVISLWNTETGNHRDVAENYSGGVCFFPDGKKIAYSVQTPEDGSYDRAISICSFPEWKEIKSLSLPAGWASAYNFSADEHNLLTGSVCIYENRRDFEHYHEVFKVWDIANGNEVFSASPTHGNTRFTDFKLSPDQRILAAVNYRPGYDSPGRLYLINPVERSARVIELGDVHVIHEPTFHPSGKWLAVPVSIASGSPPHDETPAENLPQPRIQIVDVAAGKIVETLVAPQCYLNSMAFSPDGKTLASSGDGEVLLWDFEKEPGAK